MIQVLKELNRLVAACGGNPATVSGWAGLGDLMATSGGGRNGRFGEKLASGCSAENALDQLKEEGLNTIEGHIALPHGIRYAKDWLGSTWSDDLPLLAGLRRIIDGNDSVPEFIEGIRRFRTSPVNGSPQV
jgi:glycerol-3-phosphate dehydrogenase (NAD(P)+)